MQKLIWAANFARMSLGTVGALDIPVTVLAPRARRFSGLSMTLPGVIDHRSGHSSPPCSMRHFSAWRCKGVQKFRAGELTKRFHGA